MAKFKSLLFFLARLLVLMASVYLQHPSPESAYDYGNAQNFKIPKAQMDKIAAQYQKNGGRVLYKQSKDYPTESTPWNPKCTQRPYAILQPATYEDARDGLMLYKQYDQEFAIMAGGHDFECESITNTTVLDLGLFQGIKVDIENEKVIVQAGVRWMDVYKALDDTGYEVIGGMCPTVGVAGFTLGGGFHWRLSHFWGSAAQNVKEAVVVLANGDTVRATRDNEYSDLMWALMGAGGSNFGLVLQFTFQIHAYPSKHYTFFSVSYVFIKSVQNYEDLISTAAAWKQLLDTFLEKEGNGGGSMVVQRPDPNQQYNILSVDGMCQSCDFEEDLANILSQYPPYQINGMNQKLTTLEYEQLLDQSLGKYPTPYRTNNPGAFLAALPVESLATFLRSLFAREYIGYQLEITPLGNVIKNSKMTSLPYPDAKWKYAQTLLWEKESDTPTLYYLTGLWDVLVQEAAGDNYLGGYINYDDLAVANYEKIFFGGNLERLSELKRKYDPNGLFQRKLGVPLDSGK